MICDISAWRLPWEVVTPIADAALAFIAQRLEMAFPVQQVVHLHQVEARDAPERREIPPICRRAVPTAAGSTPWSRRTGLVGRRGPGSGRSPPRTSRTSARSRSGRHRRRRRSRSTSRRAARSAGSSPTLKVIQVPMPITGRRSPVLGIARRSRLSVAAPAHCGRKPAARPSAPIAFSTARRPGSYGRCVLGCVLGWVMRCVMAGAPDGNAGACSPFM